MPSSAFSLTCHQSSRVGPQSYADVMDESDVTNLLSALLRQGEVQAELLRSIDARLVEVVQGLATVADVSMG